VNKNISHIIADLLAHAKGGEDLSAKINRLRDEIKKVVESEDEVFGKFRGLLRSFQEVIPDESQRYHAAIKALSTTSKLGLPEIIKAVNDQAGELKILEKSLLSAVPGRDELNAMEARSKAVNDEMAKLRENIARLEGEEAGLRTGMAAREKEMGSLEKAVKELFTDIGSEIASFKKKVEEFPGEAAVAQAQPAPQKEPVKTDVPARKKESADQKIEIQKAPEPMDPKWQKKCPMCGGIMNLHTLDKMWICYSCAHEDSTTDEVPGNSEEKSEYANAPEPAPASGLNSWPSATDAVPSADLASNEHQESKKKSSPSIKTKTCPSCRKKMFYYPEEKAWRCPSCHYETRSIN